MGGEQHEAIQAWTAILLTAQQMEWKTKKGGDMPSVPNAMEKLQHVTERLLLNGVRKEERMEKLWEEVR